MKNRKVLVIHIFTGISLSGKAYDKAALTDFSNSEPGLKIILDGYWGFVHPFYMCFVDCSGLLGMSRLGVLQEYLVPDLCYNRF